MTAAPPEALGAPRRGATFLVAVAAALLAAMTATFPRDLPFRLDDYVLLPRTGMLLGVEPWRELPDETSWRTGGVCAEGRGADLIRPFFRPAAWAAWHGVRAATAEPLAPEPFRAVSIAAHAFAAGLLAILLRRGFGLGAGAALFGAALFAIHPAGRQAYTWISALPDVLMVVGALSAALAGAVAKQSPRPGRAFAVVAGAAFFGAASKEGFLVLLPFLGWAAAAAPGRASARFVLQWILALAAGVGGVWLWRRVALGDAGVKHFVDLSPAPATALRAGLDAAWQALVPLNQSPFLRSGASETEALAAGGRAAAGLIVAGAIALAFPKLRDLPRYLGSLAAAAIALVATLLPAAILTAEWPASARATAGLSRSFYATGAVLAVALAVALGSEAVAACRTRRSLARLTGVVAALLAALAAAAAGSDEAVVARDVREGLASLAAARAAAGPHGVVAVVGGAVPRDGLPRLEHVVEAACAPPFAPAGGAAVVWAPHAEALLRRPELALGAKEPLCLGAEIARFPRTPPPPEIARLRPAPAPALPTTLELRPAECDGPALRLPPLDAVRYRVEFVFYDDGPFAVPAQVELDRAALPRASDGGRLIPLDRRALLAARFLEPLSPERLSRAETDRLRRSVAAPPVLLRVTALGPDGAVLARSAFVRAPFAAP